MAEPFCQLEPATGLEKEFVEAVKRCRAETLDRLLSDHSELREKINEHWFAFDSPAILAAKQNQDVLEVLLKHGANVNERSSWWAGSFGVLDGVDREMAEYLVSQGAQWTVHTAAEQGKLELVRQMIEQDSSLVTARGGDGQTPLHYAATSEIIDYLLSHGAELEIRDLDHSGTPAQYAVDNPDKCRHLLKAGAKPDVFLACALGDRELVECILSANPDAISFRVGTCPHTKPIHVQSHNHIYFWKLHGAQTVLDVCKEFAHASLYEELFSRCSPEQQLIAALWDENSEVVKRLNSAFPYLVDNLELDDKKQLARAAWEGKLASVRLMLECGFDPHIAGDEDSTPLDRAAFHGHRDIVELLLKQDAQPPLQRKNQFGGTPLGACVWGSVHGWKKDTDYLGTASALIRAGSEIDERWLPIKNEAMDNLIRQALDESPTRPEGE